MSSNNYRSILLPLVVILFGGILVLGLCYLAYFAIYMFVESTFFQFNPTAVPAGVIRNSYAFVLLVFYLLLFRTKLADMMKAIILIGPMTLLIIAAILALYEFPFAAIAATALITGICVFLIYHYKKPWIYYYSSAVAMLAAVVYAWPRS